MTGVASSGVTIFIWPIFACGGQADLLNGWLPTPTVGNGVVVGGHMSLLLPNDVKLALSFGGSRARIFCVELLSAGTVNVASTAESVPGVVEENAWLIVG